MKKVFKNFTTEEKSLNREKNLWFVTDFSPDFWNRDASTNKVGSKVAGKTFNMCGNLWAAVTTKNASHVK